MDLERIVIDNIKRIRKEKRITQEQLAEACSTATSYIGLMETYKNVPKLSTIEKISNALDVEPEILFKKNQIDSSKEEQINKIVNSVLKDMKKILYKSIKENFPAAHSIS